MSQDSKPTKDFPLYNLTGEVMQFVILENGHVIEHSAWKPNCEYNIRNASSDAKLVSQGLVSESDDLRVESITGLIIRKGGAHAEDRLVNVEGDLFCLAEGAMHQYFAYVLYDDAVLRVNVNTQTGSMHSTTNHTLGKSEIKGFFMDAFRVPHVPDAAEATVEETEVAEEAFDGSKVHASMVNIVEALRADEGYAWSWYCNLKTTALDTGATYGAAADYAARFLFALAQVDIENNPRFASDNRDPHRTITSYGTLPHVFAVVMNGPEIEEELFYQFKALIEEYPESIFGLLGGGAVDWLNHTVDNTTRCIEIYGPDDTKLSRARTIESFVHACLRAKADGKPYAFDVLFIQTDDSRRVVAEAWLAEDCILEQLHGSDHRRQLREAPKGPPDYAIRINCPDDTVKYGDDTRQFAQSTLDDMIERADLAGRAEADDASKDIARC